MKIFKTFLAIVGAAVLLLFGIVMVGGSSLDPQSVTATADRPRAEVREAVFAYLKGATETRFADRARLDIRPDGAIHLSIGRSAPFDLTMAVALEPGAGRVKARATYNADRLAWSQPDKVLSTNLHRCLHDDFRRLMAEVHNGQYGRLLDLDAVMARARRSTREVGCAP